MRESRRGAHPRVPHPEAGLSPIVGYLLAGHLALGWTVVEDLLTILVLVLLPALAAGGAQPVTASRGVGAFAADIGVALLKVCALFAVLLLIGTRVIPWLLRQVVAKPVVSFLLVRALGRPRRTATTVRLALGQIREFSFILATAGAALGLLAPEATSAIIAAAIVSIALNPLLRRLVDASLAVSPGAGRAAAARVGDSEAAAASPEADARRYRAVLVGHGPVGRTLLRLLQDFGSPARSSK